MTSYMMFAGLGMVIYIGLAYAEAVFSGYSGPFFAFLSNVLAALLLFCAYRLLRKHSYSVGRPSAWRRRIVVAALVFFAGGVAIVIASTRESSNALTCSGQCRTGREGIVAEASIFSPTESRAALVSRESTRALAAGRTLFHERGCVGCHQPDATGIGPTLHGLFGSPVRDPACGVAIVDEPYLREAILNPSATVALGFAPVMPTFAGLLTEEELQALIEYVKSLSDRP
jgi:mono/diheme cytochrome c family protein